MLLLPRFLRWFVLRLVCVTIAHPGVGSDGIDLCNKADGGYRSHWPQSSRAWKGSTGFSLLAFVVFEFYAPSVVGGRKNSLKSRAKLERVKPLSLKSGVPRS